jgi:hypothetical protein
MYRGKPMNPKVTAFWATLVFVSGTLMFTDKNYDINDRWGQFVMVSVSGIILVISLKQIYANGRKNKPQP